MGTRFPPRPTFFKAVVALPWRPKAEAQQSVVRRRVEATFILAILAFSTCLNQSKVTGLCCRGFLVDTTMDGDRRAPRARGERLFNSRSFPHLLLFETTISNNTSVVRKIWQIWTIHPARVRVLVSKKCVIPGKQPEDP